MGLKEFFLWQLEHEAGTSRKVIERVPEGRNSWKPHERSMELGYLSALVASMPGWIEFMVNRKELDLSDPANEVMRTKAVKTRAELCQMLAEGLAKSRKALEDTTEEHLTKMWRFRMNGKVDQRRSQVRHDRRRSHHPPGSPPRPAHCVSSASGNQGTGDLRTLRRRTLLARQIER